MVTLDDFQNGTRPEPAEPPRLQKVNTVRNPSDTREKPGSTVLVHNRGQGDEPLRGYYSSRNEDENLFRMYDSYPISESILRRLDDEGAERVFIAAKEGGETNVYEFTLEQYLRTSNRYVWKRVVEGKQRKDPQKCPARDDAVHVFEGVNTSELFLPVR